MTPAALTTTAAASITGAIVPATIALAGLSVTATGRLDARLTAAGTEAARLGGLLEGLGPTGRAKTAPSSAGD